MELVQITGSTYYIPDSTVIGVYVFSDRSCILIDSAANQVSAPKILNLLKQENLTVYAIINTHCHGDHCGGNNYMQEQTGCRIFAAAEAAALIENPLLQAYILYSAAPPRVLKSHYIMPRPSTVTDRIDCPDLIIKSKPFRVLNLPGHSLGHLGLVTPDGVVFTGDALIHTDILAEYPFIYLSNLSHHLESLETIKGYLHNPIVLSHGGLLKNPYDCWRKNQQIITEVREEYVTLLSCRAMSREELIQSTVQKRMLHHNHIQYYLTMTTVSAYLSYLTEQKKVRSLLENGLMKYEAADKSSGL